MDRPRRMMQLVDMEAHLCTITRPEEGKVIYIGPLMISLPSIAEGNHCCLSCGVSDVDVPQ